VHSGAEAQDTKEAITLKNPEQQRRQYRRKNRRGKYVHPQRKTTHMVFFSCLFLLYLNLAFVRVIFGRRGIAARRAAVNKEGLISHKTAIGTADRREKPAAFGTVL